MLPECSNKVATISIGSISIILKEGTSTTDVGGKTTAAHQGENLVECDILNASLIIMALSI